MHSEFGIDNKGQTYDFPPCENGKSSELLIDWFQVTIFPSLKDFESEQLLYTKFPYKDRIILSLFNSLFNLSCDSIYQEETGYNGYDIRYSYKNIYIMINSMREDMGVNILLTGKGCRDFEELNISWQTLFNRLCEYDINFNRIDIAIDTFTPKYFTIDKLIDSVRNGLCCSKFKRSLELIGRELENGGITSSTLQFGSKSSEIEITFYDKYKERKNAGYIIDNNITFWIRTELRFRHDKAKELFNIINDKEDYSDYIRAILYNYIDFKSSYALDTNKSRRPTIKWWKEFVGDTNKLSLVTRTLESSISRKYNWLLSNVSKTELMCYISNLHNYKLDTISIDLTYQLIVKGSEKITDKDIFLINEYRLSKKMPLINKEELLDYVEDLKNKILE